MTSQSFIGVLVLVVSMAAEPTQDVPAAPPQTLNPDVKDLVFTTLLQGMSLPAGPVFPAPFPGTDSGWVVHVQRSGGFTGGVKEDFTLNSLGGFSCAAAEIKCAAGGSPVGAVPLLPLTSLIVGAKLPIPGAGSSVSVPGFCSDCITTGISLWRRVSGRDDFYSAAWDVTTQAAISPDILKVYDAVMAIRRDLP